MILDLDLKETDEFKGKEVSVDNEKFMVLIENMVENYRNKKPLPNSDVIAKQSQ